jgi:hypothetical protein
MKTFRIGVAGGLLFAFVTAMAVKAQETRLDKMVAAALHGPELKKFKYINHEFNVKKAKITDRVTGITKIEGQISHHLLFRPDEQFYYLIEKQKGRITKAEFKIERETLAPYASRLTKALPQNGIPQTELDRTLRQLDERRDTTWECEAEFIAFAIALRVDPLSHQDLVTLRNQTKRALAPSVTTNSPPTSMSAPQEIARALK